MNNSVTNISRLGTFKAMAPSRTIVGHYALNGQMRSKAHTTLISPLVLHPIRIYKCAMKKIFINGQMQNKPFLIVIYRSSLVKAAMNAARFCNLRNGVNITPQFLQFLLFSMAKGGTKTIAHLSIAEGSRF